jgi:drug/metabolite transporter (DMT)-like permease
MRRAGACGKGGPRPGCQAGARTAWCAAVDSQPPRAVAAAPSPGLQAAGGGKGPAPSWAPPPQRILLGILFICAAGTIFPVMNAAAKTLGAEYSSLQVSWARAFGHILFLLAVFVPRHGVVVLRTRRPWTQLARSAMLFTSNLSFFLAIVHIPLAKAAAISLTAPLIVAILAWPMLRERTTPGRVVALCCGFLGVLIVIRPGTAVFHWASVFVLASATCYGVYQILTRRIAATDMPETSAIYSSVVGGFAMFAVLPFVWVTPDGWFDLALFASLGVLGAIGHYCVARAMGYAPANVVSPFQYFQLLAAVAVGWVVFGDWPDAMTWLGAAVIVGAGLWIGWSQRRAATAAAKGGR